jgi:hypothetical protein
MVVPLNMKLKQHFEASHLPIQQRPCQLLKTFINQLLGINTDFFSLAWPEKAGFLSPGSDSLWQAYQCFMPSP